MVELYVLFCVQSAMAWSAILIRRRVIFCYSAHHRLVPGQADFLRPLKWRKSEISDLAAAESAAVVLGCPIF